MKKIKFLLIFCLLTICACMLYLVKSGVSLRSQFLISPSLASEGVEGVAIAVNSRLFPNFQKAHYTLFGFLPFTDESIKFFDLMKEHHEKTFHQTVNVLEYRPNLTTDVYKACSKPCWILMKRENANQLKANELVLNHLKSIRADFFTLTWMTFKPGMKANEDCLNEKRLDFECITPVSVQQAEKKLKKLAGQQSFFMTSYNDEDFFIFVQN